MQRLILRQTLQEAHEEIVFTSALPLVAQTLIENLVDAETASISKEILETEQTQSELAGIVSDIRLESGITNLLKEIAAE